MPKKTKVTKKSDGAIVVPVTKVKTKSGRDAKEVLGLREKVAEEFGIKPIEGTDAEEAQKDQLGRDLRIVDGRVLIKFPKFVHLIVMHDFEEVMEKHADEDIVISSELLVDLANAHEEAQERAPWGYLLAGLVLGILLAIVLARAVI